MQSVRKALLLALGAAVGFAGSVVHAAEQRGADAVTVVREAGWKTFSDAKRHFSFQYPASWEVDAEPFSVVHYREVFCSLNSLGKNRFKIREQQTAPNTWEFGVQALTNQLPPGAAYLDIGWWEGPAPRFGPDIQEMTVRDLSGVTAAAKETETADLVQRQVEFSKWGRRWSIMIYLRPPVAVEIRRAIERVLASFRYEGVPAGDPIWAIGEARKKLPPEADPDRFEREGGSGTHYVSTASDGDDVLVTFTKREAERAAKAWRFRVTGSGKVEAIPSAQGPSGQP
jgi:hypothetical protein